MAAPHYFLTWSAAGWQAARLTGDAIEWRTDDSPVEPTTLPTPQGAKAVLEDLGYRGEPVCLGLPTRHVLAAPVSTDGLPRQGRQAALLYRLEEQLPVDAEYLAAAFLPAVGTSALGLAVEKASLAPLLDGLHRLGVHLAAVCPIALLAAWDVGQEPSAGPRYCVMDGADGVDVLRLENAVPTAWHWTTAEPADLARCLRAALLAAPPAPEPPQAALLAGEGWPLEPAIEDVFGHEHVGRCERTPMDAAARTAARVLAGQVAGWADLAGPLGLARSWRRLKVPLKTAAVLAALLLLVLTGGFWWRAEQYAAVTVRAHQRQEQVFRQLFPNRPLPLSVRGHLASELARVSGVPGAAAGLPATPSALETLRRLAAALPADVRLRIAELRLGTHDVFLAGQTRTHADAEAIARSLQAAGFAAEAPRTEQTAGGGVGFTLAASAEGRAAPGRTGP